jgi:hypothetical protein
MAYFPHPDCPILQSICPKADTHAQNWGYIVSFELEESTCSSKASKLFSNILPDFAENV